jgi:hypothetical protein
LRERTRHRWEDNIGMYLQEAWGGMVWIDLAHNRYRWQVAVTCECGIELLVSTECRKFLD